MHQTTVRFGRDLWEVLEQEAERLGVSAAQYVRDATLARLAYAAARQDEAVASREAFSWAGGAPLGDDQRASLGDDLKTPPEDTLKVALAEGSKAPLAERVEAQVDSAIALQAEGKLARSRAERLRLEAEELRKPKAAVRKR